MTLATYFALPDSSVVETLAILTVILAPPLAEQYRAFCPENERENLDQLIARLQQTPPEKRDVLCRELFISSHLPRASL